VLPAERGFRAEMEAKQQPRAAYCNFVEAYAREVKNNLRREAVPFLVASQPIAAHE
jgi:hypothetical protein